MKNKTKSKKTSSNASVCMICDAGCCRNVSVQWEKPTTARDWEQIRWLVAHKNICVYLDHDNDWLIEFTTDCKHLDKNSRCNIYEKRMTICKEHPADSCEMSGEEPYYKLMFRNAEDVEAFLKEKAAKAKKKK